MRKLMESIEEAQRQDSLQDQLRDLVAIANQHGMYDAADYIDHVLKADYDSLDMFEDDNPCWDGYEMIGMKDKNGKEVPNCVPEGVEEFTIEDAVEIYSPLSRDLREAEYQGRDVKLNKPMRGDVKKFKVYVKNDKGNVVKVNFGDPDMKIRKNNPEARKSFRARHKCDQKKDKTTAGYWSCKKW